jgi:uncharacterized damage-inducible protein DinB
MTMPIIDSILMELDQEAATTRRVLERVPEASLAWKPHAKSMSLGELALHVATTPGGVAEIVKSDTAEVPQFTRPSATSKAELLSALDRSIAQAKGVLGKMDDATLNATWTLKRGNQVVFSVPRVSVIRSILLNHWYHHRGQLSVYLRLLNVPVPSIYGPSADENPFG